MKRFGSWALLALSTGLVHCSGAGGASSETTGAGGSANGAATSSVTTSAGGSAVGGATGGSGSDSDAGRGGAASGDAGSRDRCAAFAGDLAPGCMPGSFCELFTEGQYKCFFSTAKAPYSYAGLIAAADKYYPTFAHETEDLASRKREAAAFLANVAHETVGFQYAEEIACSGGKCFTDAVCTRYLFTLNGVQLCYDGRGAIQLTGHGNYRAASMALVGLGLMGNLETNPELVSMDPEIAIATAVWFWMARSQCHAAMVAGQGFGATVQAINGGIECGMTQGIGYTEWLDRLNWFRRMTSAMGIEVGDVSGCN